MKVTLDKADVIFSQFIRLRDRECKRCYSKVRLNAKGLPISHNASHFHGRGKESTRFDEKNVDTLCFPCHSLWGGDDRVEYEKFKRKQLGEKGFRDLGVRARMYCKRDRKLAYIIVKELFKDLLKAFNEKPFDQITSRYDTI